MLKSLKRTPCSDCQQHAHRLPAARLPPLATGSCDPGESLRRAPSCLKSRHTMPVMRAIAAFSRALSNTPPTGVQHGARAMRLIVRTCRLCAQCMACTPRGQNRCGKIRRRITPGNDAGACGEKWRPGPGGYKAEGGWGADLTSAHVPHRPDRRPSLAADWHRLMAEKGWFLGRNVPQAATK